MPRKTESKQIGEYTYTVTALDALQGRKVFVRLTSLMAPALSKLQGASDDTRESAFMAGISETLRGISEEDFDYFCDKLAPMTAVSGGEYKGAPQLNQVFVTHFAAEYFDMIEWLYFALKVNFESFFQKAGARLHA